MFKCQRTYVRDHLNICSYFSPNFNYWYPTNQKSAQSILFYLSLDKQKEVLHRPQKNT